MPYIPQNLPEPEEDREYYNEVRLVLRNLPEIKTKGGLEYLTYLLALKFMQTRPGRYSTLHEAVYAIVHSAHEFERNFLDKREDVAKEINGDITL